MRRTADRTRFLPTCKNSVFIRKTSRTCCPSPCLARPGLLCLAVPLICPPDLVASSLAAILKHQEASFSQRAGVGKMCPKCPLGHFGRCFFTPGSQKRVIESTRLHSGNDSPSRISRNPFQPRCGLRSCPLMSWRMVKRKSRCTISGHSRPNRYRSTGFQPLSIQKSA